jgi:hypothetical protein
LLVTALLGGCIGYSERRGSGRSDDDDSAGDDDDVGDDDDNVSLDCGIPPGADDFGPAEGQFLPDIEVQRADGSTSSIYELCGRVTLLDLDSMWNPPGIDAQSIMEALYQDSNSSGLAVATILIDGPEIGTPPTLGQLEDWATDHDLSFPVVKADESAVVENLIVTSSGSFGIPYFIVLDRNLRIDGLLTGADESALSALVQAARDDS